jgi:hypothetical protein
VKRFVAALMLVNGLLVAGGANATELGPLTYDCALNPSNSQIKVRRVSNLNSSEYRRLLVIMHLC